MVVLFLAKFIEVLFDLMSFAILARIILSWFAAGGGSGGGRIRVILHDITEPILGPFRKIVPRLGMIDISPIVALITLDLARVLIISLLTSFAAAI